MKTSSQRGIIYYSQIMMSEKRKRGLYHLSRQGLIRRGKELALRYGLWERGERLLVAVSGGPDSVTLLSLLNELRPEFDLELAVVHLDHGLRGSASLADCRWVQRLAARLKLPCIVGRKDVKTWARKKKKSLEEAARELRYAFFQEVSEQTGIRTVALGHQADDQAETVLMRLVRGSGPRGLGSMRPCQERGVLRIIRPLLPFWREEIIQYLAEIGWEFREDASNRDRRIFRNRLRLDLLPLLEKEYNPRIKEILVNLARMERERDDFFKERLEEELEKVTSKTRAGLEVDLLQFQKLPAVARGEVLRKLIQKFEVADLNRRNFAGLEQLIRGETGRKITLTGGLDVSKEYDHLLFIQKGNAKLTINDSKFFSSPLPLPGEAIVKKAGVKIITRQYARPRAILFERPPGLKKYWEHFPGEGPLREYLDRDRVTLPLSIRSRRPGDRYRPLKLPGTKKVKDILIDEKVPRTLRAVIPLIVDRNKIIWLTGYRPAHECRITEKTKNVLEITLIPLS